MLQEKSTGFFSKPSVLALIGANLAPVFGVLFFGWSLFSVMLFFWLESAVIGFFNALKMLKINPAASIFLVPFFAIHYGGFMLGHLLFLIAIFLVPTGSKPIDFSLIFDELLGVLSGSVFLFASHGYSFFHNFLGNKEFETTHIGVQMFAPYKRIVIMHVTIIFGAMFAFAFGAPIIALLILIALKTIIDVFSHAIEHKLVWKK